MSDKDPENPLGEDFVRAEAPSDLGSSAVSATASHIAAAIETGRKPGMPLSVLSNMVREAPLGSLFAAFLFGVAFARRR
jgi:hypothetical protein